MGVSLNYLLGETKLDIPEEYYQAKYKLMKSPVYGDLERIKKKLKDIEELYDNYIDILPEEELLTIDIIERYSILLAEGHSRCTLLFLKPGSNSLHIQSQQDLLSSLQI